METKRLRNSREHGLEGRYSHCHCGEYKDRNMRPEELLVMFQEPPNELVRPNVL